MTDLEILQRMRQTIEGAWTDTFPAEDYRCVPVHVTSWRAQAFSARGVLARFCPGDETYERVCAMKAFDGDLQRFESHLGRTEKQMLAAIDAAIKSVSPAKRKKAA